MVSVVTKFIVLHETKNQEIWKQNEIFVNVSADHFKIGGSAFARSTHKITDPDPDPATRVNTDPSDLPPFELWSCDSK